MLCGFMLSVMFFSTFFGVVLCCFGSELGSVTSLMHSERVPNVSGCLRLLSFLCMCCSKLVSFSCSYVVFLELFPKVVFFFFLG